MRNVVYETQRTVGILFLILILATIITNITIIMTREGLSFFQYASNLQSYPSNTNLLLCLSFVLFAITTFWDNRLVRYAQGFLFCAQSYIAILDGWETFWGWGLLLVSIMLLNHYGFWNENPGIKITGFSAITIAVFCISIIRSKKSLSYILGFLIYAFFIVFFYIFIKRNELKSLLQQKNRISKLLSQMTQEKMALEELKELIGTESSPEMLESLKNKLQVHQAIIKHDEAAIRDFLLSIPRMDKLSQGELDLTSLFFIHRGGLSNKELAYMLKTSEDAVKNRFKVVFNKTNTASRTELYSHIASYC